MARIRDRHHRAGHAARFIPALLLLAVFIHFFPPGFDFFIDGVIIGTLQPWWNLANSIQWERVPCRILSAHVVEQDNDGETYLLTVEFDYVYDGRVRRSDRASFFRIGTSGSAAKELRAKRLLADPAPTCLVNPANPDEAVLDRSFGWIEIITLWPLALLLFLVFALLFREGQAALVVRTRDGWYELPAAKPSRFKTLLLLLLAIGWNGVIYVETDALVSGEHADESLFVAATLLPCMIAGLVIAGFAIHRILVLRNPSLLAELSEPRLVPGEPFRLRWKIDPPDPLTRLAFRLVCREISEKEDEANSSYTSTITLAEQACFETTERSEFARGEHACVFPADGPAPVAEPDRRIAWFLVASGEIPNWPDLSAEFELPVARGRVRHV